MKRLVACDLDGALAQSKQPIDSETATLLARLTHVAVVAIISGGLGPSGPFLTFATVLSGWRDANVKNNPLGFSPRGDLCSLKLR
jgi:hypothetical protein